MRGLSIRAKVTLWYTLFMILLVVVLLGILVAFSETVVITGQKKQLMEVVEDAMEDIEEEEKMDSFEEGVYLLQYDNNQKYVAGSFPTGFSKDLSFKEGEVQIIKENNRMFYVYDRQTVTKRGEHCWVRGIVSDIQTNQRNAIMIGIALILFPLLVISSSVIGYRITKKAFEPVTRIQETAKRITDSGELSMRIGLPEGKDEISKLGNTVDIMLEELEKSFEKEKQFTSDASHELRTPISVILTESEYMLAHVDTLEEARESMEVVNRQANKMSVLINQLLFFTRAEEGKVELQKEAIVVEEVLEAIRKDFASMAKEAGIHIHAIDVETPAILEADRMLLIRAVQNLVQNAIVYGRLDGNVEMKVFHESGWIVIEVKDDGIGIAKKELNQIWNRFYQADQARSAKQTGSMGLGLSMVKWITEKHGGYVQVESELGRGSKFLLYFPSN